jgi:hypothetical protein
MADELKVDPVALHLGSNQMLNAVGEASLEFVSHEDGLADAAPGWIGSSQLALAELAAGWGRTWPTRWSTTSQSTTDRPRRSGRCRRRRLSGWAR